MNTDAPPAAELTPSEQRRLLLGAYLVLFGLAATASPLAVCLTSIGRSLGDLSPAQLGLIASSVGAGLVIGLVLLGPWADRWGLRPFLLLGCTLLVAGLFGMALAPVYLTLLAAAVLAGIGGGVSDALTSPLVAELRPHNRAGALSILHGYYPLGVVFMTLSSSLLLSWTDNWRLVFPVMSLPMVAAWVIFATTRIPRHQRPGEGKGAVRGLATSPIFWVATVGLFLAGATELGPSNWTPAYVEKALGWSREAGANVLLVFALLMALGRFANAAVVRRIEPARIIPLAAAACAPCLVVAAVASPLPAVVALALLGLMVSSLWPTILAYAADRIPQGGVTMFSVLAGSGNAAIIVAPSVVGFVGAAHGLRWGMGALVIFPLLAAMLFTVMYVSGRQSPPPAMRQIQEDKRPRKRS